MDGRQKNQLPSMKSSEIMDGSTFTETVPI